MKPLAMALAMYMLAGCEQSNLSLFEECRESAAINAQTKDGLRVLLSICEEQYDRRQAEIMRKHVAEIMNAAKTPMKPSVTNSDTDKRPMTDHEVGINK